MQAGDVLLGKFRVEHVLGSGGMGQVLAVRHVELDELFAMKLMHAESHTNPEATERFLREARAAARLKGEHVARVHDVGRLENGMPYMLMEHLVGDDLSALLDKRGMLPLREAAEYIMQACEALAEAHGYGIVHRDLKPANLFLTGRANGTPCIKVLDFGISKKLDPTTTKSAKLTVTGAIMGTPAFMSPEQMLNSKSIDTRADIWALGAILYELTTGALPFHGESLTELVAKVMDEAVVPPSSLRADLPKEFDHIVLTCLQKRPARRYQSLDELMAALRPFTSEIKSLPPKIVPISSLPKIDNGPDSEKVTTFIKPPAGKAVPNAARVNIDDVPESEKATLVIKPNLPIERSELPSAVDTAFNLTNTHTVEMPTQVHRQAKAANPVLLPTSSSSSNPSKSSRNVLVGVAGISILAVAGIALAVANNDSTPDTNTVVNEALVPSATHQAIVEPASTLPFELPNNNVAPTTSVATAESSSKSGSSLKTSPAGTPKMPTPGPKKPTLY